MAKTLLTFVLTRLDQIEAPVFLHREIEVFPSQEVEALLSSGILRETSRATEVPRPARLAAGGDLVVRLTERGIFGVAADDDFFDPIPLSEDDVRQYEVSVSSLVAKLRRENDISGAEYTSDAGLVAIGQKSIVGSGTVDVYLSFPNEDENVFLLSGRCFLRERSHALDGAIAQTNSCPSTSRLSLMSSFYYSACKAKIHRLD